MNQIKNKLNGIFSKVFNKPDLMIDLGDTTMVDKFGKFFRRSESQYKAQRY